MGKKYPGARISGDISIDHGLDSHGSTPVIGNSHNFTICLAFEIPRIQILFLLSAIAALKDPPQSECPLQDFLFIGKGHLSHLITGKIPF
jgi:hypothetical protein